MLKFKKNIAASAPSPVGRGRGEGAMVAAKYLGCSSWEPFTPPHPNLLPTGEGTSPESLYELMSQSCSYIIRSNNDRRV
jgi:hypothetical protein